jgi:hypothetical protein
MVLLDPLSVTPIINWISVPVVVSSNTPDKDFDTHQVLGAVVILF